MIYLLKLIVRSDKQNSVWLYVKERLELANAFSFFPKIAPLAL